MLTIKIFYRKNEIFTPKALKCTMNMNMTVKIILHLTITQSKLPVGNSSGAELSC